MKKIVFLLLFPLCLYSQMYDDWVTPFATVEFEDDIVIYKYSGMQPNCPMNPKFLLTDHIKLVPDAVNMTGCKETLNGIEILKQYLLNSKNPKNDKTDKLRYLKAFTLQTILALRGDGLPSKAMVEKIGQLAMNPDKEIAKRSDVAMTLNLLVEKTLKENKQRIEYISEAKTEDLEYELFSSERLVAPFYNEEHKTSSDSATWPKFYGEPNRDDFSYDISESYDNGYYLLGGYENTSGVPKYTWLLKTDINGNILWDKVLKCEGFVKSFALEPSMDGGLMISGLIILNNIGLSSHPFVVKLNACGEKEWCKIFTESPNTYPVAIDIKETPTGDIVLLVNMYGQYPEETMHLFKLSAFGEILWKKPYCSGYVYEAGALALGESILITSNNKYLISGNVYWEDPWNPGGVKIIRPLFVMVGSFGIEEWILPFGLQDTIYGDAFDAIELENGDFIGAGSQWPDSGKDGLFITFNSSGNALDYNVIDLNTISPIYEDCIFINLRKNDTAFITGGGLGDLNQGLKGSEIVFGNNIFEPDFTVLFHRYDQEANSPYSMDKTTLNKILINSTKNESGNWDIKFAKLNMQLEDDSLNPYPYIYDSLCIPGPPQSGFIFLDDCDIITGMDIPSPGEYYSNLQRIQIKAFPNPASSGSITFEFENTEHHQDMDLSCFNVFGKEVHSEKVYKSQGETKLNLTNWNSGIYIAIVYSNNRVVGQCKFVVR